MRDLVYRYSVTAKFSSGSRVSAFSLECTNICRLASLCALLMAERRALSLSRRWRSLSDRCPSVSAARRALSRSRLLRSFVCVILQTVGAMYNAAENLPVCMLAEQSLVGSVAGSASRMCVNCAGSQFRPRGKVLA